MLKHKNIESFLPVFNGFYSTVFEPSEDSVIESPYTYDNYEFDYEGYNERVAKKCCDKLEEKLAEFGINGVTIIYQNVSSPKEYNFYNDSINAKYKLTSEAIKAINKYLVEAKEDFSQYIYDRYTDRSGFMSHYCNDSRVWLTEYLSKKDQLSHAFGAVLEFIFENEGYEPFNLYEDICGDIWLDGSLKEGVSEVDQHIKEYTQDNYTTKDPITVSCELAKHYEDTELEYLDYSYIENLVKKIYQEIDNKTLNLFVAK
jgi:hypothetical protein